jgi:hypothetical protein
VSQEVFPPCPEVVREICAARAAQRVGDGLAPAAVILPFPRNITGAIELFQLTKRCLMVPSIVGTCQGMMQKTARECDTFKGERNADRQTLSPKFSAIRSRRSISSTSAPCWKMAQNCYDRLIAQGLARVTGFEPNPREFAKLSGRTGPYRYLPVFLGNGGSATRPGFVGTCFQSG